MKRFLAGLLLCLISTCAFAEVPTLNTASGVPQIGPQSGLGFPIFGTVSGVSSRKVLFGAKAPIFGLNPITKTTYPKSIASDSENTRTASAYELDASGLYQEVATQTQRWETRHGRPWAGPFENGATNYVTQSNNFGAGWSPFNGVTITPAVDIFGNTSNIVLHDSAVASYPRVEHYITIPDNNDTHTVVVYIEKDDNTSRFAGVGVDLDLGVTIVEERTIINTSTGAIIDQTGKADGTTTIYDDGDYWRLESRLTNNSTGNDRLRLFLYPAYADAWDGNIDATAVGSCTFAHVQVHLSHSVAHNPIPTSGSIVTKDADLWRVPNASVDGLTSLLAESLGSELWTTDPKKDLPSDSASDTYANPGESEAKTGETNFQTGIGYWTAVGSNLAYTILDSGVSVLAIEAINNSMGAYCYVAGWQATKSDLTVGSTYMLTAQVKMNTGSANVLVYDDSAITMAESRDIVETEWTAVTAYFIPENAGRNRIQFSGLDSGETIFVKEWDLREIQTRSVLGDQEGDPELVVNGGFESEGSLVGAGIWVPDEWTALDLAAGESGSTTECNSGVSAIWINAAADDAGFYQEFTTETNSLYKVSAALKVISGSAEIRAYSFGEVAEDVIVDSTVGGWETHTRYFFSNGATSVRVYPRTHAAGSYFLADDISVQKVNVSWTPYDNNTLTYDPVDGGVTVEYVDNNYGAYINLTTGAGLENNTTNGDTYKVTFDAREAGGDVLMRLYSGADYVGAVALSDVLTSYALYFNSNASSGDPLLNINGFGAGESVYIRNLSVQEVTNPGTDGEGPPEGMAAVWFRPGSARSDYPAGYLGLLTWGSHEANGMSLAASASELRTYVGPGLLSGINLDWDKDTSYLGLVKWGYLVNGVPNIRAGLLDSSGSVTWGTADQLGDGYTADTYLKLFLSGWGKLWMQPAIFDYIPTDATIESWGAP